MAHSVYMRNRDVCSHWSSAHWTLRCYQPASE